MDKYEKLGRLGEGAHGVVYKARLVQLIPPKAFHTRPRAVKPNNQLNQTNLSIQPPVVPETPSRGSVSVKRHHDGTPASIRLISNSLQASALQSPTHFDASGFAVPADVKPESAPQPDQSSDEDIRPEHSLPIGAIVAIKKIRLRDARTGLSLEAIREIKLLQELVHPNIVQIFDIFNHNANLNVVMDFMEFDLENLVRDDTARVTEGDVKFLMREMLRGMKHCHDNWVLHRDMKPGNILLNSATGQVKITDFGLAKLYGSPDRRMSPQACTMWYRAPELLFGATSYGPAMDMWSMGCIMGELFWRRPLFAGEESEIKQLQRIFAMKGSPHQNDWPDVELLHSYVQFSDVPNVRPMSEIFPGIEPAGIELVGAMLELNPLKRISADEALKHPWFHTGAAITPADQMPRIKKFRQVKQDQEMKV